MLVRTTVPAKGYGVKSTGPAEASQQRQGALLDDYVRIDWGPQFSASPQSAFPDRPNPVVSISHGPLAPDYILATGGSGYFRKGFVP